jgi:hypothetical protein
VTGQGHLVLARTAAAEPLRCRCDFDFALSPQRRLASSGRRPSHHSREQGEACTLYPEVSPATQRSGQLLTPSPSSQRLAHPECRSSMADV